MNRLWLCVGFLFVVGCIPANSSTPTGGNDAGVGADIDEQTDSGEETLAGNWDWLEIEGTVCGNGATTGMGISEGTDASRLLIYFNGGGACWDGTSCHIFNSASHIDYGYGEANFANDLNGMQSSGVVDREEGPFGQATFSFLPYCTGDFHSGDAVGSYDAFNPNRKVHHKGAVNVELYLEHLTAAYPEVTEVFVLGVSAGGYGAIMNHHRIKEAFADAEVHVLSDGSPMVQPRDGRWGMWKNAWNMQIPEGCEECATSYPEFAAHVIDASPESRFGLLTWLSDEVVALYFSYPPAQLKTATQTLLDDLYVDEPGGHASAFYTEGTNHVMLQYFETLEDGDGQSLRDFVQAWVDGTP